MNLVLLEGVVARAPDERVVDGGRIVGFDLATARDGQAADAVPVRWEGPPGWASELAPGDALGVVGRVRRRFFRAGGGTQSRTEVVADQVVRVRPGRRGRRAVDRVFAAALAESGLGDVAGGSVS